MPDALKIRYVKTTKPCLNTKLLHILRERYGLKYHREFNLGGSGLHTTFVLAGIAALDANSKTVSHGVPQSDNFDGSQTLKLFAEDSPTVWRCVDEYSRAKKRYSNDIYQRYENNAAAITAATAIATAIKLIQLHFGTVAAHNDQLPLFLYLPTATRLFHRNATKTVYRCFDTKQGGYITGITGIHSVSPPIPKYPIFNHMTRPTIRSSTNVRPT
ncbi:hypothetical protein JTB14_028953 [Gonioctena quinquepunctata]|nr:hypothetical protein JTB14_028953 [Gonioctena quinquepunctata]